MFHALRQVATRAWLGCFGIVTMSEMHSRYLSTLLPQVRRHNFASFLVCLRLEASGLSHLRLFSSGAFCRVLDFPFGVCLGSGLGRNLSGSLGHSPLGGIVAVHDDVTCNETALHKRHGRSFRLQPHPLKSAKAAGVLAAAKLGMALVQHVCIEFQRV